MVRSSLVFPLVASLPFLPSLAASQAHNPTETVVATLLETSARPYHTRFEGSHRVRRSGGQDPDGIDFHSGSAPHADLFIKRAAGGLGIGFVAPFDVTDCPRLVLAPPGRSDGFMPVRALERYRLSFEVAAPSSQAVSGVLMVVPRIQPAQFRATLTRGEGAVAFGDTLTLPLRGETNCWSPIEIAMFDFVEGDGVMIEFFAEPGQSESLLFRNLVLERSYDKAP